MQSITHGSSKIRFSLIIKMSFDFYSLFREIVIMYEDLIEMEKSLAINENTLSICKDKIKRDIDTKIDRITHFVLNKKYESPALTNTLSPRKMKDGKSREILIPQHSGQNLSTPKVFGPALKKTFEETQITSKNLIASDFKTPNRVNSLPHSISERQKNLNASKLSLKMPTIPDEGLGEFQNNLYQDKSKSFNALYTDESKERALGSKLTTQIDKLNMHRTEADVRSVSSIVSILKEPSAQNSLVLPKTPLAKLVNITGESVDSPVKNFQEKFSLLGPKKSITPTLAKTQNEIELENAKFLEDNGIEIDRQNKNDSSRKFQNNVSHSVISIVNKKQDTPKSVKFVVEADKNESENENENENEKILTCSSVRHSPAISQSNK